MRSTGPPGVCQNWLTYKHWVRKYLFFLSLCHIFFSLYLSSITTNGLKGLHIVSWRFHNQLTSIDRTSVSSQSNLSSRNPLTSGTFSQTPTFPYLFFFNKTLFPLCFLTAPLILVLHFFLARMSNCYSTLMPLTNTHSHHKLTTYTLYPICTLRDRIQISWLLNMYIAIMMPKPKQKQRHVTNTGPSPQS